MRPIALLVVLAPFAARSAGVEVGLRSGYAIPLGSVGTDQSGTAVPFESWVYRAVPVELDLGYRFNPYVYAGVYGSYSFIFRPYCESGNCSDHGFRLGGNVQVHPFGEVPIDPWLGLGFGYEWLMFSERFGGGTDDRSLHGFEFAILQTGVDFTVSAPDPTVKLGPVVFFSLGTFREEAVGGGTIQLNEKLHEWLVLGLRVRFLH